MPAITVEIPDDLAANFDTPEAIQRALFEDFVIEQRQRGVISLGKAAKLLGDFLKRLYRTGRCLPPLKKGGRGGF